MLVLASCTGAEPASTRERSSTTQTTSPTTSPEVTASARPTPEDDASRLNAPDTRRPVVLADQLRLAFDTVQDPRAAASDVRRAGEFQQVAVRALATRPRAFRRAVLGSLPPATAFATRAGVTAARELDALGDPQPELPRWRIVAPPPPEVLLSHYRTAQRRTAVPWHYLAAIHLVETRMGRIRGVSTAGARGPMQFLTSTWDLYGEGGDINDPGHAIMAAARLLKANGAPGDMAGALWHYNPSDRYVRAVSEYARTMQRVEAAYRGYWHWRVLYRHVRGTYLLPVGYPDAHPVLLTDT